MKEGIKGKKENTNERKKNKYKKKEILHSLTIIFLKLNGTRNVYSQRARKKLIKKLNKNIL